MSPKSKLETRIPAVVAYLRAHGRAPTLDDLCALFKLRSKNSASLLARRLVAAGVLARTPGGHLMPPPRRTPGALRLLGNVAAGFPSPAEEALLDTITLDEYLVTRPEATFMLRVDGDSMIEAGILPGDTVLVERGRTPRNGDIVIACVDGAWTMKYFQRDNKGVRLEPANKTYATIHPRQNLIVEGVVSGVIRKLV